MLDTGRETVRCAFLDIHHIQPGPAAVIVRCRVQERAIVHEHRKSDARVVGRHSLWTSAGEGNPPDVHLVERQPVREIHEPPVWRPGWIMRVQPRTCDVDAARVPPIRASDEDRITGRELVVRESGAIG